MKRSLFIYLLCFSSICSLFGQIQGKITDSINEPLAFASIYIQGTSIGTSSNNDGLYSFDVDPGEYNIIFQYIGFEDQVKQIQYSGSIITLDIILKSESIQFDEITIAADAEDPAYPIIRKAISKRKYYLEEVNAYNCDVYVKGNQKILDAPTKFMGQDVGAVFEGALDSNNSGIVYLSESIAKLHFKQPDKLKEIMYSSKISGNDNGFSFNSASQMDFNFYRNSIELNRSIVSPIANGAMSFYRYRFLGTKKTVDGFIVNKIKVIPKRKSDPVFRGIIYITEDLWNIESVELKLDKDNIKVPIIDSLVIKQIHRPSKKNEPWRLMSQTIDFKMSLFVFKLSGVFSGIYNNYVLNPVDSGDVFNNAVFKVESGANTKDDNYWDTVRPIPLTPEEVTDYKVKTDLQFLKKQKWYQDSLDRIQNKFSFRNILFGYRFNQSFKNQYWEFIPPTRFIHLNTINGWHTKAGLVYSKDFDDNGYRAINIKGETSYGFSEKKWRANFQLDYKLNETNFSKVRFGFGQNTEQFNEERPVYNIGNTWFTWRNQQNLIRIFDKLYTNIEFESEITNGIWQELKLEYSRRDPLLNIFDGSNRFQENRAYVSNDPRAPDNFGLPSFESHEALNFNASFRFRPNQKFLLYPNEKYIVGSDWPDIFVQVKSGLSLFKTESSFLHLSVLLKKEIEFGVLGRTELAGELGQFLNKPEYFIDYKHFNGNEVVLNNPLKYMERFLNLPYYKFSTVNRYSEFHVQHHFNGFIFDKIPLVNRLNLRSVIGFKSLVTPDFKPYSEIHFGIDNIGFKVFRLFRFDVVRSFGEDRAGEWAFILGIKLDN